MALHDFVPAWLNFSTPQSAKSAAASLDKHADPRHHHREARPAVNRRRHNSSDGFFNCGPLRAPAGDGWQEPSLLRHDSVDSGVAKGGHGGLAGGPSWKEAPSWQGGPRGGQEGPHHQGQRHPKRGVGDRDRQGPHRQRNGNFHPRKGSAAYQDKFPAEEGKDSKEDKLKFVDEDFPSLNPEASGKPVLQVKAVAPHAGVWENPPSGKQMVSKMLVIKKVSKDDPSPAFTAGFASAGSQSTNGNKAPVIASSSVYKNLVPKPVVTKSGQWKPGSREISKPGLHLINSSREISKPGLHMNNSSRDNVFTSSVSAAKPSPPPSITREPSSTTPPIDITPSSRLKLMRRGPDRKSEFLRALKDEGERGEGERGGDLTTSSSSPGTPGDGETEGSTPEPKAYGEEDLCHQNEEELCHQNGLAHSLSDSDKNGLAHSLCDSDKNGLAHSLSDSDTEHLSSSLEAEHRLLKAMGWQEHPENDDNFLPLTEDELREFQTKTEQLKRRCEPRNGAVLPRARGVTLHFTPWQGVAEDPVDEGSESETSSSQTSDDDNDDHRHRSIRT